MKLQITLNQNQKDEIRERYESLHVFQLCTKVRETYIGLRAHICFADAEVFYNVMQILDEILTNPRPYHTSCSRLWDDSFQAFKQQCPNEQADDVKYQTMLVFMAVNILLQNTSEPAFRTTIADNIFAELWRKDEHTVQELLDQHCEAISSLKTDLIAWLEEYFQHDRLLSKEMEDIVDPPSKKKKTAAVSYCCFQYNDNNKARKAAMEELYNTLIREHLIDASTKKRKIELLFGGENTASGTIKWIGKKYILSQVVKNWIESKIVTCYPKGTSHWDVVRMRFVDRDGKPLGDMSHQNYKGNANLVRDVTNALLAHQVRNSD